MNKIVDSILNKYSKHLGNKTNKYEKKLAKNRYKQNLIWCIIKAPRYKEVSFKNRLKMYRLGQKSDEYVNYELDKNDPKEYLTDMEKWDTKLINGEYSAVLNDKLLFSEVYSKYLTIPQTIYNICDGTIIDYKTGEKVTKEQVLERLNKCRGIVFKPKDSAGGKGIHIITNIQNNYQIDCKDADEKQVLDYIASNTNCFISEYAIQHEYSRKIFPKSVNTIRVVTGQMKDTQNAEILLAMHRFGNEICAPVDNACSGGVFAPVDIETGKIGKVKSYRNNDVLSVHPNTKEQIEGVIVPNWEMVKSKLLEVANKTPYIKFVGWDVVITDEGFSVIEGNGMTGFGFFQMYGPYRNTRLGDFYRQYGAIK